MADEIKQPGYVGQVQPLNPSRSAGRRKRPRQPPQRQQGERRTPRRDDDPHQVDEYV
jgi:hypothetical protein